VNQAPVTGESIPVAKDVGSPVYAGTVNGDGALVIRITRLAEDNTISRIIRMVEEAQGSKAPTQRFVDRFAKIYTPAVVGLALLIAVAPPLLGWGDFGTWFYRALVLLVISCPCALVISTPVTIVSAIAAAARIGVLVKGGVHLEELGQVRTIAFDKTGTLTRGMPEVVSGYCSEHGSDCDDKETCPVYQGLLASAAAVEAQSQHPLAKAVVAQAERIGAYSPALVAQDVQAVPGQGVTGTVNGHRIAIGNHQFVHDAEGSAPSTEFCKVAEAAAEGGRTTMVIADLCCNKRGLISVADEVRPGAARVIADLRAAGIRRTVMLTGDNESTARAIAERVGIDDVRAGLKPDDKVAAIRELMAEGRVAMLGDGVNDAPAMAQSSVGIAMGAVGTDAALETADIALMADDLGKLVPTIKLGRRTLGTIQQNIVISLVIKVAFLALALSGVATLWMAVFADVGTSMLVILNGMRLLRFGREDTGNPVSA
jgi:Zn2+/Cd2+-exporting ATPase